MSVVPIPERDRSASMNWAIRSAEVSIASLRAVRTSPAENSSESSSARVATAVELASSPAAWPPIPSATTSSVLPA